VRGMWVVVTRRKNERQSCCTRGGSIGEALLGRTAGDVEGDGVHLLLLLVQDGAVGAAEGDRVGRGGREALTRINNRPRAQPPLCVPFPSASCLLQPPAATLTETHRYAPVPSVALGERAHGRRQQAVAWQREHDLEGVGGAGAELGDRVAAGLQLKLDRAAIGWREGGGVSELLCSVHWNAPHAAAAASCIVRAMRQHPVTEQTPTRHTAYSQTARMTNSLVLHGSEMARASATHVCCLRVLCAGLGLCEEGVRGSQRFSQRKQQAAERDRNE